MHFVTNTIYTKSKVPTLSEVFKAARTKAALADKTASATGTVKTAANIAEVQSDIRREAGKPGKGNIENLTAPKFGPKGKKEKGEEKDSCTCGKQSCKECNASKIASLRRSAEESAKDEGETSGQPQAEAKLVNDPNKDPKIKEGKGGSKGTPESDEAEGSGQLDVEPLHQKGESTDEKPGDLDTMKTDKKKEAKTVANALKKTARFKRFSELTPKQKEFLRGVYSIYWPKAFIDALLASQ